MKTIYKFHYDMVNKHINELELTKETIIKSFFLFNIFKKQYKNNYTMTKIKSQKIFSFNWTGIQHFKGYRYANFKYILRLIDRNCINCDRVKSLLEIPKYWMAKNITHNDIDTLFNKTTNIQIRYEILDKISDNYCKFGIISGFECYKFYYKISK